MEIHQRSAQAGQIEARRCPLCGQEHWGITTRDGVFIPLRTGMAVELLPSTLESRPPPPLPSVSEPSSSPDEKSRLAPWVPEPLHGNRELRLKYGVFLESIAAGTAPHGQGYQLAYRDKLRRLLEKEAHTSLPVILDRYFSAPHLASGDPKAITDAMWRELDEIRRPALLMQRWIEDPAASNLANLIYPRSAEELDKTAVDEGQLADELNALSLEGFLDLL